MEPIMFRRGVYMPGRGLRGQMERQEREEKAVFLPLLLKKRHIYSPGREKEKRRRGVFLFLTVP